MFCWCSMNKPFANVQFCAMPLKRYARARAEQWSYSFQLSSLFLYCPIVKEKRMRRVIDKIQGFCCSSGIKAQV